VEGHGFKSLPCFAEAPSGVEGEVEGCREPRELSPRADAAQLSTSSTCHQVAIPTSAAMRNLLPPPSVILSEAGSVARDRSCAVERSLPH